MQMNTLNTDTQKHTHTEFESYLLRNQQYSINEEGENEYTF